MESFPEEPIKWEAFLKGEAEVLVPECVMDAVTEEQLTALTFWQLEKVLGMTWLLVVDIVLWILLQLGINEGIKRHERNIENN